MTATRTPGEPLIDNGKLISTSPATGEEVGRFEVADAAAVEAAVSRARRAATWWRSLGYAGRKQRLLKWRSILARRLPELALLMHREGGKPIGDAIVEAAGAIDHIAWAAKHARKVLGPRRIRGGTMLQVEYAAHLNYEPYGVIGVIGPWNYPVFTPVGSVAYALAAGNAVVFKPSEYTPSVGQWLVNTFAEVVAEEPVFQAVHGRGETGGALCRSGVDKVAFTGSTATGKKVAAACAETLTPVLVECGGKDAMIVDSDANLDAAADAAIWGGMYNAGQTCIGIERIYVHESVADELVKRLVDKATGLTVGADPDSDIGPITMPRQSETIRRHIADAVERGATVALGGNDAVEPPYVRPTILVDVPEDSTAVTEETFGPTLVVNRVKDTDEAVAKANAVSYGLGGAVFGKRRAMDVARRLRSGMTSINSAISFAALPALPFGGVGDSGYGRIHGADGLREFGRAKSIARRRMPSAVPVMTFRRGKKQEDLIIRLVRILHGRG